MARVLIRQAHGGETREIDDRALPYFPGWVILDTLDDSGDVPPLYLSKAESDFRYAKTADLSNPASAAGVALRAVFLPRDEYVPGGGGTTDPEVVRDTIAAALVAGANVTITVNDTSDTITVGVTGLATTSAVEGTKVHDGTTGGGTRPTGYARVRWTGGTARPTNMAAGDVWEHDA